MKSLQVEHTPRPAAAVPQRGYFIVVSYRLMAAAFVARRAADARTSGDIARHRARRPTRLASARSATAAHAEHEGLGPKPTIFYFVPNQCRVSPQWFTPLFTNMYVFSRILVGANRYIIRPLKNLKDRQHTQHTTSLILFSSRRVGQSDLRSQQLIRMQGCRSSFSSTARA